MENVPLLVACFELHQDFVFHLSSTILFVICGVGFWFLVFGFGFWVFGLELSPVGVSARNVPVGRVLGMSDSATSF